MSQNGQVHFKNFAAADARFLKCVWPFWDIREAECRSSRSQVFCRTVVDLFFYFKKQRRIHSPAKNIRRSFCENIAISCILDFCPVDTQRRFNVYKTSIRRRRRRIDVFWTSKRRCGSTGWLDSEHCSEKCYIADDFFFEYWGICQNNVFRDTSGWLHCQWNTLLFRLFGTLFKL